jgi:hypothetical protein
MSAAQSGGRCGGGGGGEWWAAILASHVDEVGGSRGDMDRDRSGVEEVGKAMEFSRSCDAQVKGVRRGEIGLIPSQPHLYSPPPPFDLPG